MAKREKKERTKASRILRSILLGLFLCLLLTGGIIGYSIARPYLKKVEEYRARALAIAAASSEDSFRAAETSLVYAADGTLLSALKDEKDVYYLSYENLPQDAIRCMLVTEDRQFYNHMGFDVKANLVAAYSYLKNKGIYRGGSTITQQLARNVFLTMDVTLERKITELFLAAELEKRYSKAQILEFYLNNIYFANGYYGIQAASIGYFNKNASALSLSQIAFLCAIPNNPTKYDPVAGYEKTLARRDKVLLQLFENGVITQSVYQTALAEEITLNRPKKEKQDYAETYSYHCAVRALMKAQGFEFRNSFLNEEDRAQYEELYYERYYSVQRTLFTGGYRIYSSIDPQLQAQLQEALDTGLSEYTEVNEEGVYALQGSAVCIDNETGRVAAIIGGRSQEFAGYTLNRAYQSARQAGSAIKPLIIYTPLFERGLYPDDLVLDEYFEDGPKNSGNAYSGEITVRRAVEISANTVAWKLLQELTVEVGLSYLLNMNFSRIVATDYVPAVSLGGFTYGVSAVEMAAGYCTIENGGRYREPTCIVMITDAEGKVLVGDFVETKRVYESNAAAMMTDVLKSVMTAGTARKLTLDNMISAGKTGTASDRRDGWFAGFTHYYTTSVWVGYDMPRRMEGLSGSSYPGQIWQDYMNQIHAGLESVDFAAYKDTRPPKEPEEDTTTYNAFGEPIDPETGLPYVTDGAEVPKETGEEGSPDGAEVPKETGEEGSPDGATPTPDPRDVWFDNEYERERRKKE